jgi:hypothetical protein
MIDLYCERLGPGLWAEPLNAATNLSFLIAACVVWRLAEQRPSLSPDVWLLIGLIAAIGTGSGLFHTFAATWSMILDVVPILLFQLLYVWVYCRRIVEMRFGYSAGLLVIYMVFAHLGRQFPHLLNGSIIYAPAVVALLVLGLYHCVTRKEKRFVMLSASGIFFISLISRTVDAGICPYFQIGTHFLWHIFNSVVLYLSMKALLFNLKSKGVSPGHGTVII